MHESVVVLEFIHTEIPKYFGMTNTVKDGSLILLQDHIRKTYKMHSRTGKICRKKMYNIH